MAELADAADSKSADLRVLGVRLPLPAPILKTHSRCDCRASASSVGFSSVVHLRSSLVPGGKFGQSRRPLCISGKMCELLDAQIQIQSTQETNLKRGRWFGVFPYFFLSFLFFIPALQAQIDDATRKLSYDIFKKLIENNSPGSVGSVTLASEAMAERFRNGGFAEADIRILGPNDRKKNLVVRLHGTGKHKPLLLIGHLDVVEAHREDWTTDPFKFVEKDGFYYGRGTQDMKSGDAIMATTLIRFKKEGYTPDRDIILALTADEEGGKSNGVDWLLKNHRDLIDAEFVFNHDGGGIISEHGKPVTMTVDATEKLYADFQLSVTNPGGHSSLPRPDNAIYSLAAGLARLQNYQFPFELNEVTRAYYERMEKFETPERIGDIKAMLTKPPDAGAVERLSKDPIDNSTIHTTCVATRFNAGHANNALPQRAEANVNCRILPGHSAEEVRQELIKVFAEPKITVRYSDNFGVSDTAPGRKSFPPPPLRQDV